MQRHVTCVCVCVWHNNHLIIKFIFCFFSIFQILDLEVLVFLVDLVCYLEFQFNSISTHAQYTHTHINKGKAPFSKLQTYLFLIVEYFLPTTTTTTQQLPPNKSTEWIIRFIIIIIIFNFLMTLALWPDWPIIYLLFVLLIALVKPFLITRSNETCVRQHLTNSNILNKPD